LTNVFAQINEKLHEYSQEHVASLCSELVTLDRLSKTSGPTPIVFSAFTVDKPFGFSRLVLSEILSEIVVSMPTCLNNFPSVIWKTMAAWFLDYSHNNIYQHYFFRIVQVVFTKYHELSIENLLKKHKFLSSLIKSLSDPSKSAAKGYAIQICNLIRFASDLQPANGSLKVWLQNHDVWKTILPILRTETEIQRRAGLEPSRQKFLVRVQEDDTGIDIGSTYARSLGFDAAPLPLEEPVVQTPDTFVIPESNSNMFPAMEGSESPNQSAKKKKKKKKKKSKNSIETGSPVLTNGHAGKETEEEEDEEEESESSKNVSPTPKIAPAWWDSMKIDLESTKQ